MSYTEKMRKSQKRYREKHREELRKRDRKRYNVNPEKYREKTKKWRRNNYKKWILKNREKERKRLRKWENNNREKVRLRLRNVRWINKFLTLQKISGKRIPYCAKCRNKDLRILTINHTNGISRKEKLKKKDKLYRKIRDGERKINDLEVRCFNCNVLYEFERKRYFFNRKDVEKLLKEKKIIHMSDSLK